MKSLWASSKWMAGQARPYIFSLLLLVILGAVSSLCSVGMAVATKNLIDAAAALQGHRALYAAGAFAAMILGDVGIQALVSVRSTRIFETISNGMRENIFSRLSQTEWFELSQYHSEDILTRMTSDIETVANGIVNVLPEILSLGVLLGASFLTLLFYDPMLAVFAFVLGPASVLFSRFFGKRLKKFYIRMQESESAYRAYVHEAIQNMTIIKAFCFRDKSIGQIRRLQNERLKWVLKRSRMSEAAGAMISLGYWAGYFIAFLWGALRLSKGAATFGTLAAFLQLVEQVQAPFVGLAHSLPQVISTASSAGRLMELEKLQLEKGGSGLPYCSSAGVCFDNVSYSYDQGKQILDNISLEILPGETIVLMGASGEGKTTIIRLLLSFIHPNSGQVYITGNHNEKFEACASFRSLISYVPQGNTLFSGTIAENLRIGATDASDFELEQAADAACALQFIRELPEGFDTVIGERGLGLSEGQAQRIAIARALLRKTPVLILDEATSALDMNTEIRVLQAIQDFQPACTCMLITHRTTAVEFCDRVFVLEAGHVFEKGKPVISGQAIEAV